MVGVDALRRIGVRELPWIPTLWVSTRVVDGLVQRNGVAATRDLLDRLPRRSTPWDGGVGASRLGELTLAVARRRPLQVACLGRSMTIWGTLRVLGYEPTLQIGLTTDPDAESLAHAWVELGGEVIGDEAGIADEHAVLGDPLAQKSNRA